MNGRRWKNGLPHPPFHNWDWLLAPVAPYGSGPAWGNLPNWSWTLWQASPICFRLLAHLTQAAASRTFWTAGRSNPIRIAMIAITTSNSMSVNPRRRAAYDVDGSDDTRHLQWERW